jgi:hypothetical protein
MAQREFSLLGWADGAYPGVTVQVALYQSVDESLAPVPLSAFVEASYPGYVRQALPQASYLPRLDDGSLVLPTNLWFFAFGAGQAPGCTCRGYYLVVRWPDGLEQPLAWADFPAPVPMLAQNDYAEFSLVLISYNIQIPA